MSAILRRLTVTAGLAAALGVAPRAARAQEPGDSLARALREARHLLQGVDEAPFLDTAEVRRVAEVLLAVRRAIPEVRDITQYDDDTYLMFELDDGGMERADSIPRPERGVLQTLTRARVGLEPVDSLNVALGVDSLEILFLSGRPWWITPWYSRWPNVPVLAKRYERLPGVVYAGPPIRVGGGDAIGLQRRGGLWYFTFTHAWGDCPSGCVYAESTFVVYDPSTGEARRVDRLPGGVG